MKTKHDPLRSQKKQTRLLSTIKNNFHAGQTGYLEAQRKARLDPNVLTLSNVALLQRTIGNRALSKLLHNNNQQKTQISLPVRDEKSIQRWQKIGTETYSSSYDPLGRNSQYRRFPILIGNEKEWRSLLAQNGASTDRLVALFLRSIFVSDREYRNYARNHSEVYIWGGTPYGLHVDASRQLYRQPTEAEIFMFMKALYLRSGWQITWLPYDRELFAKLIEQYQPKLLERLATVEIRIGSEDIMHVAKSTDTQLSLIASATSSLTQSITRYLTRYRVTNERKQSFSIIKNSCVIISSALQSVKESMNESSKSVADAIKAIIEIIPASGIIKGLVDSFKDNISVAIAEALTRDMKPEVRRQQIHDKALIHLAKLISGASEKLGLTPEEAQGANESLQNAIDSTLK